MGQILDILNANGVKMLYGVTGDTVFPLFDYLSNYDKIKFIGTVNEVSAAFMAAYQAKLTDKIGVCVATSGPGTANLINGLAEAYYDRVPVLAITGQVKLSKIKAGRKQYINQQKLLQEVTYSSGLITSSDTVLPVIGKAIEDAVVKKTVTHVSIPEDVFFYDRCAKHSLFDSRALNYSVGGFSGHFEKVKNTIQDVNKPLLVVGINDKKSADLLTELADKIGAALVIGQQAKGIVPDSHPRVLGGIGEAYIPEILGQVDLILQIGSVSFERKYLPSGVDVLQIVGTKDNIDYSNVTGVVKGDVNCILYSLIKEVQQKENQEWEKQIKGEKNNLSSKLKEQRINETVPLHPAYLMTVLSEVVPEEAIIVCDIGSFAHWFDTYFQAENQTILISSSWRSMGMALPAAIGSALNEPDKKVIALIGDGGLLVSVNELVVASEHNLSLTVIVANNRLYDIEKQKMEKQQLQPFGVEVDWPDFVRLAESFSIKGVRVSEPQKLSPVVNEALQAEGPIVVDVQLARTKLPYI